MKPAARRFSISPRNGPERPRPAPFPLLKKEQENSPENGCKARKQSACSYQKRSKYGPHFCPACASLRPARPRLSSVFIKMPGDFQSDYFQIFNPFKPDRFSLASPKINAPNTFRRAIPFAVAASRGAVARVRSCACDLFATRNRHAPTFFTITRSHP